MKRNWFKAIIGGLSLTSAVFIFQACYGSPQDFGNDIKIGGKVVSKSSGLPIEGIKVSLENGYQYEKTNKDGDFIIYTERADAIKLIFEDIDQKENGLYSSKDTIINTDKAQIELNIELEEK